MKIRSVLLGSAAIAGLTTAGYAADLGVVTSLDICDQLGLSGLTISSDDNCLQISGNISFEYDYGNYDPSVNIYGGNFARSGDSVSVIDGGGSMDSAVDIDWWLKFVATSSTDFGPATATLKLVENNWNGSTTGSISVKEAWVGVGDTTMLMAGYKGSIFNNGDDTPLNLLGLFNSSNVSTGVGFYDGVETGGAVIQVVHNLGNGLSIGAGLENLQSDHGTINMTTVGVMNYTGDGITAHISGAMDQHSDWNIHAGFTGTFDQLKVVGAIAADNDYLGKSGVWWNVLGSASYTFDMFTLAGSFEATAAGEWGVGASGSATVSDGVSVNLAGRYFTDGTYYVSQVEAGVSAAVTEAITLSGAVGGYASTGGTITSDYYAIGKVTFNPGGGFTSSASLEGHQTGGYKAVFTASKSIK